MALALVMKYSQGAAIDAGKIHIEFDWLQFRIFMCGIRERTSCDFGTLVSGQEHARAVTGKTRLSRGKDNADSPKW